MERGKRINKSPKADGSAEQYVRTKFPEELNWYRQRSAKAATALLAIIDADLKTVDERLNEFEAECDSDSVDFRQKHESVAIVIPKRNIETWIQYLDSTDDFIDEQIEYPKLERPGDCKTTVEKLVSYCRSVNLPKSAPPSLIAACVEFNTRLKPII